jgi:glycosyltransferase involved in cell wall biosynthesis
MAISAVILTFNEEIHIERCIESLLPIVEKIYVMDSYSTDNTLDILFKYEKVKVKKNKFVNHSLQFNLALEVFDIESDWVIRIDADEYIDLELQNYLQQELPLLTKNVTGINVNRYMNFMGARLNHGGMDSYWMLRVWRNGLGTCEQKWMDEHIVVSHGDLVKASGKLIDDNKNNLSWWTHKHVDYSTREAIDIIIQELDEQGSNVASSLWGTSVERMRFLKNLYNNFPIFVRPFIYFFYRYFLRLGFLDGKQGFLWCVLQGFWYRMMVDAKVFELKSEQTSKITIKEVIKKKYGYDI